MNKYEFNYRIATSLAGISSGYLYLRGIPGPDLPLYQPYSSRVNLTTGGQALRGFSNLRLLWQGLDQEHGYWIAQRVETVLTAKTPLYLTVDLGAGGIGSYPRNTWVDVSGTPLPVDLKPTGNTYNLKLDELVLEVRDLTIENNPATGVIVY